MPDLPRPPASNPHSASAQGRRLVWTFALALLVLNWCAITFKIHNEESLEIASINQDNLNLARALEEHTLRTLKSVDQAVMFLKYQYERHPEKVDIAAYVRDGMIFSNLFNQLGIIDEYGKYILSNLPNHKVLDLSDREHFRVHIARDTGQLFISKPVLGRASGKWSLQLTRRINKPDGSFGGVVVVSLDPLYFTQLYADVNLGPHSVITLLGLDGIVRARKSGKDEQVGQSLANSPILVAAGKEASGTLKLTSSIDKIDRFFAYRVLFDYPLMVIVGSDRNEALAETRHRAWTYLAFGGLITLTVLAFSWGISLLLARLEQSRAKAEEANRLKSEFLASMSHELRTPLNGIIGYAELLQESTDDQDLREYAGTIHSSGSHLLELVNSILDLAKIEAGRFELAPTLEPLQPLLQRVVQAHQPQADGKGLALNLEIDRDVPRQLLCDHLRLTQVLNNLVHNGVKFTDRGTVDVSVRKDGKRIRFAVRDSGPGIAPADQETIFDKFRQGESFATRRQGGSGLGLALSRQLVELLGGRLTLQSEPGRGSEFYFTLPIGEKEE